MTSIWTNCKQPTRGFHFLGVSDIHLLHPRTPTRHIIDNWNKQFYSDPSNKLLDAIIISGDVFEGARMLNDERLAFVELWIYDLLVFCKEHDIILRVLEGTPSHDAKQSRMFEAINRYSKIGCDVRHVVALEIEFIEKHGISILYVPDEWKSGTAAAWADVKRALKDAGIDRVHMAVMHGCFPYQLSAGVSAPYHDIDNYLSVVSEFIQIGHVHTPSEYDRVVVPGSYDRMSHGEEHDKGYIKAFLKGNGRFNLERCWNPSPYPYLTADCTSLDMDESLAEIDRIAAKMPKYGFLRIQGEKNHTAFNAVPALKDKYPHLVFTTKTNKDKTSAIVEIQDNIVERANTVTVTKDNIYDIAKEHLAKIELDNPEVLEHLRTCVDGL